MNRNEYVELLKQKQHLLVQIIDNTESQIRFIRQQKMVGLRRLLRNRRHLLDALVVLIHEEQDGQNDFDSLDTQILRQKIQQLQQQLGFANNLAVKAAQQEKARIAEQMRGNSQAREIQQTYIGRWYQGISRGFSRKV
jgi:hypothetical protein